MAVLLVILRHFPSNGASRALQFIQSIGWTVVDLFFVLSGLFFGLSVVLGGFISHAVERPFLRLRAKWFPAVSRPVYATTQPGSAILIA
jgi:peptidoglycan/LPS O-acetylase OafA/YrhL